MHTAAGKCWYPHSPGGKYDGGDIQASDSRLLHMGNGGGDQLSGRHRRRVAAG